LKTILLGFYCFLGMKNKRERQTIFRFAVFCDKSVGFLFFYKFSDNNIVMSYFSFFNYFLF
ncbi:MAG: hypothetical protein LBG77_00905, partial [Dysgonamonadaceae bacterium]|nr:hypothetical protein [Dysgonamonadaceae bacterium]